MTSAPPPDGAAEPQSPESRADETLPTAAPKQTEAAPEPPEEMPAAEAPPVAEETLSPAVRRLVRQYDLDVTGIHGSGPSGRIRVSDVMAFLGGRTYTPQEVDPRPAEPGARQGEAAEPAAERRALPASSGPAPMTTLFECDMSSVLAHRKQLRQQGMEVALTSYFLVACSEALRAVPEVAGEHLPVRLGAELGHADGELQTAIVDAADGEALDALRDRVLAADKQLRFSARSAALNPRLVDLVVHHHGLGGSVVATPTPIGEDHTASVGIGKIRREIALREEDATPRVAARCYVSLSFVPERLELHRANRFLAQLVRVLEHWPP